VQYVEKMGWKTWFGLEEVERESDTETKKESEHREEPLITVSRQLTLIREDISEVNTLLHSGFNGLREDHHRILEEQVSVDGLKVSLSEKKQELEGVKEKIEEEIELLGIDSQILERLEEPAQSANLAEELGVTRQYVSSRLGALVRAGFVEKYREGRKVYYALKE